MDLPCERGAVILSSPAVHDLIEGVTMQCGWVQRRQNLRLCTIKSVEVEEWVGER